ncbi:MAG: hypothetical protein JJU13_19460 [Balneolaceae bacterium]|nr:hypothetical protein [Balneolaceae bacterium]
MKQIKRVLFVILFIVFHNPVSGQALSELVPSESDSVHASYIMGTEDYFWQTGWNYSSIERMSVMINSGNYGFYGPQPTFMLNDIPFDPTFFGITYSQLFPVPYLRVKNREIHQASGVHEGVVYHSGLMQIHSEPLKRGISIFGSGQIGHNSGEPGPWVFDPESVSPNVERFGPWVDGGLSVSLGNWYAKGVLRYNSYVNIDEFIQTRLFNTRGYPEENLWLDLEATTTLGLAEAGYDGRYATIRLQGIQSESKEFLFFQPLAREVPTGLTTEQYSALANFRFNDQTGIRTLFQLREKATEYRRNRFDHSFGWAQTKQIFRGSFYQRGRTFALDVGAETEWTETEARGMDREDLSILSFFLKPEFRISEDVRVGTTAVVQTKEDSSPVVQSSAFIHAYLSPGWDTKIKVSHEELYPQISNPVDAWSRSGYDLYMSLGILSNLPPEIENNRLRSFSNHHYFNLSPSINLEANISLVQHLSLNIPAQYPHYNRSFNTHPGLYTIHRESGTHLRAGITISHSWNDRLAQRMDLSLNRTLEGSEEYRQYQQMSPAYHLQYSFSFKPYHDIKLGLNAEFMPERNWSEFENLDGRLNRSFHVQFPYSYYRFSSTLPQMINVDARVSKWFWQQRLRASLLLKNLLNNHYQTHPMGVRESFGYMVRLEMRF